jgi:hypothetical protein
MYRHKRSESATPLFSDRIHRSRRSDVSGIDNTANATTSTTALLSANDEFELDNAPTPNRDSEAPLSGHARYDTCRSARTVLRDSGHKYPGVQWPSFPNEGTGILEKISKGQNNHPTFRSCSFTSSPEQGAEQLFFAFLWMAWRSFGCHNQSSDMRRGRARFADCRSQALQPSQWPWYPILWQL